MASHGEFQYGDVFTGGLGSDSLAVGWYHSDLTLNRKLETDPSNGGNYATGMAFDKEGNLYVTTFGNRSRPNPEGRPIVVFNRFGEKIREIFVPGGIAIESIVFDAQGNFYVGDADRLVSQGGSRKSVLAKFDATGNFLRTFIVEPGGGRGTDWIDLAADQCTMFYTSEGLRIKRFDVCADQQLPDFAVLPVGLPHIQTATPRAAYALRVLPDGGLLVADTSDVHRLDADGNVIHTYWHPDVVAFFALSLDPDGRSFWTADYPKGEVYKFDIESGIPRKGPTKTGSGVFGLAVFGERTAAVPPAARNRPPSANPGAPRQGVEGAQISFDGSESSDPDGDSLSYDWDFGDGAAGYGPSPVHRYRDNGAFDVHLTVTDDFGMTATATTTASIANGAPDSDAGGPYRAIWGSPMAFSGRAADPGDAPDECCDFIWDFGDGTAGAGPFPSHSYGRAGNYRAALTVRDKDGTESATNAIVVIEAHRTSLDVVAPQTATYGDEIPVSATLSDAEFGTPIEGKQVGFNLGAESCSAVTGPDGRATCSMRAGQAPGPQEIRVTYGGECDSYHPARRDVAVEITKAPTTLNFTGPDVVEAGTAEITTRLTDSTGRPVVARNVSMSVSGQSYEAITGPDGIARATLEMPPGLHLITAEFAGDDFYLASTTSRTIVAAERTNFVIWGGNSPTLEQSLVPGDRYIFWGAQWRSQVTTGNFAGRSDFKGYADRVENSTWSARPGNSSSPPPAVSSHISVIVATEISKQGSLTTGNIAARAILAVDDPSAYASNPGHVAQTAGQLLAVLPSDTPESPGPPVLPPPEQQTGQAPSAYLIASPQIGVAPLVVTFDGSRSSTGGGSITNYAWEFGDGGGSQEPLADHTYLNPGCYGARLEISDDSDTTASMSASIRVGGSPPQPELAVSPPSGPGPLNVTLDASRSSDPDGDIEGYRWDFGDGSFGTGAVVSHRYGLHGSYLANVGVIDKTGLATTATAQVTVENSSPAPLINAVPRKGGTPLAVEFDGRGSADPDGSIVAWEWDFGDGSASNESVATHTYESSGPYEVRLKVVDDAGLEGETTQLIEPGAGPPGGGPEPEGDLFADLTATPFVGDAPLTVAFDATKSTSRNSEIVDYFWDFGGGMTAIGATQTRLYERAGNYPVKILVTDSLGRQASNEAVIFVAKAAPAPVLTAQPAEGNAPLAVTFDATASYDPDGSITKYYWDFKDGPKMYGGPVMTHTYSKVGTYSASVTVTDDDGIERTATVTVVVTTELPVADFTASPPSGTGYQPLTVTFDATTSYDPDGTITTYQWLGPSLNKFGPVITHTFPRAGTFQIKLVVTDNVGGTSSKTVDYIVLNKPPVAELTASPTSGFAPLAVEFDASGSYDEDGSIISYKFDFGDSSKVQTSNPKPTRTYLRAGNYQATVTALDNQGALSDPVTQTITVWPSAPIAAFTAAPESGRPPLTVVFNAQASKDPDGSLQRLIWDFGDGTSHSTTARTYTKVYPAFGVYEVKLTVIDNDGLTGTATATVRVEDKAPVAALTASPGIGLAPLEVTFSGQGSADPDGVIVGYSYDFGDGSVAGGPAMTTATHTYPDPGTYEVRLTVTDDGGNTDTATALVVAQGKSASIEVTPATIGARVYEGEEAASFRIEVRNSVPDAVLLYNVDVGPMADHIEASPTAGIVAGASSGFFDLILHTAGLGPGLYRSDVLVSGQPGTVGSPVTIPVELEIISSTPAHIGGRVTRSNDNAPILGAKVAVTGPHPSISLTETVSDASGGYLIGDLRAGTYTVIAEAGDGFDPPVIESTVLLAPGEAHSRDFSFTPLDTTPPTVSITSPANPTASDGIGIGIPEIGCGAEVRGSVADNGAVTSYQIQLSPRGAGEWTPIAQGNGDVSDGLLGTICASSLLQGPYELRVVAFDSSQNRTSSQLIAVSVAGDAQPGALKMSFRDVRIPVQGLPIEIYRSYDSTDPASRDFGAGWSLGIFNARVQKDANENVILDIPGQGKRRVFYHTPLDQRGLGGYLLPRYSAGSGAYGTLTQKSYEFNYPLASCQTIPRRYCSYEFGEEEPYDPQDYQYRSPDGAVWELNVTTGVKSVTDPNGNKLTVTPGGIISSTGKSIAFERDTSGRITKIVDPEGAEYHYGYDGSGDLISYTNAAGNTTTYSYDAFHHLASITDPTGAEPIRNQYRADGRLAKTNDAIGGEITYSYDDAQRSQSVVDQAGRTTAFFYDSRGNVVETADAQENSTLRQFDANDNLVAITDTLGRASSFTYDAIGNQTSSTDAEGATTRRTYNAFSEPTTITDPFNHRTNYEYDSKGNLTKTTYADGEEITTTVDTAGNPIVSVGSDGGVWRSSYDGFGNLTGTTNPLGETSATTYDNNGRPVAFTDPTGAVSSQEYDGLGRATSRTDATGRTTRYQYDGNDQVIAVTDNAGSAANVRYDVRGKLASRTDALGHTTTYSYDAVGNLASESDPDGRITRYGYDSLDRLTSVTDAVGGVTRYDFDAAGQMTRLTDANGHAIAHTYWPTGRLATNEYADGSTMSFGYDTNGNLTQRTKRDGTSISYTYDNRNRLRITTLSSGRQIYANYNTTGLLTSVRDTETGEITYSHDLAQRVTTTTKANGAVIDYGFDPAGRVSSLTVGSRSQSWIYDPAGRTTSATDFSGAAATLSYDTAGRLATLARPGAAGQTAISYDDAGRVTRVNSGPSLGDFKYAMDAAGNRTTMTETLAGFSDVVDYSYDPLNRLVKESRRSGSVNEFAYDAVGNRTRATGQPDREYDALDQVVGWDYDENGNLLGDDDATYAFDELDRLTSATKAGDTSEFSYDPEGNLLTQTASGAPTSLTVDSQSGLARVLLEQSGGTGAPVSASYSYCSASCTKVMSVANSAGHRWTYADALGSIRALGDDTGNATDAKTYDAYGAPGPFSTGTNPNPYGFAGERTGGSGLQWLRARWYAPGQGRFLSRDPATRVSYLYSSGNPVTRTDPSGLFTMTEQQARPGVEAPLRQSYSSSPGTPFYVLSRVKKILEVAGLMVGSYVLGSIPSAPQPDPGVQPTTPGPEPEPSPEAAAGAAGARPPGNCTPSGLPNPAGWGLPHTLQQHVSDHGADFGGVTPSQYVGIAESMLILAQAGKAQVKVATDGTIRVYDPTTNTFASFNSDGTAKTVFKPVDKQAYWDNQPGKPPC